MSFAVSFCAGFPSKGSRHYPLEAFSRKRRLSALCLLALDLTELPAEPLAISQARMAHQAPIIVPQDTDGQITVPPAPVVLPAAPNVGPQGVQRGASREAESSANIPSKRQGLGLKKKLAMMSDLLSASKRGDVLGVLALLDGGANPDWRVLGQWRAIDLAAAGGHADLVEALLQAGAGIAHEHFSPLYLSCARNDVRSVRALLRAGARAGDCAGARGRTALHRAAAHPDGADQHTGIVPNDVMRELLQHVPPEAAAATCASGTPLHVALRLGRLGNAAAILEAFPKHAMLSANGICTLDVALSTGDPRVLALVVNTAPLPMGGVAALAHQDKLTHAPPHSARSAMQWMVLCRVVRDSGCACTAANVRLLRAALAGTPLHMDAAVEGGADAALMQAPNAAALIHRTVAAQLPADGSFSLDAWLLQQGMGSSMPVPSSPVWQEVDDADLDSDSS